MKRSKTRDVRVPLAPADRRVLAEGAPYTVASMANGGCVVTPATPGAGVLTRLARARIIAAIVNAAAAEPAGPAGA